MSDDLIKRSDVLSMIDAFERDFQQSWRVQFCANINAIPAVKDDRIEQLERELVVAIEVVAESGRKRGEAEAKLAKAAAYLQKISRHANRSCSAIAARALAELEKSE
jgi:hypothetical protein